MPKKMMLRKNKKLLDFFTNQSNKNLLLQIIAITIFILLFYILPKGIITFNKKPFWMDWCDQSVYYRSTKALYNLNFDVKNHFYPPFFPLLGSLFYLFLKNDPFTPINLLSFVGFLFYLIKIFRIYIKKDWVIWLIIILSLKISFIKQFFIPWTSHPVRFFLIYLIYKAHNKKYSNKELFLIGLCAGLIIPTRPTDTVMAFIVFIYIFIKVCLITYKESLKKVIKKILILSLPGFFGLGLFLLFNILTSKDLMGNYQQIVKQSYGQPFEFSTFPLRLISILFDSSGIYGLRASTLLGAFPLFFFSICGIPYIFLNFKRYKELCIVSLMIITQWIIYTSYVDLLAVQFWLYGNYHYFLWQFPILGLICYIFLKDMFLYKQYKACILIIFCVSIFSSIGFKPIEYNVQDIKLNKEKNNISFIIDKPKNAKIKYLEIKNISTINYDINTAHSKIKIPLNEQYSRLFNVYKYSIINKKKADLNYLQNQNINKYNKKYRIIFVKSINKNNLNIIFDKETFDIDSLEKIQIKAFYYKYQLKFPEWFIDYFSFFNKKRKIKLY